MAENVIEASEANFAAEVLESPIPVLIDFWAPWCGPCRMIAPIVEELAGEYEGKLKVVKVNVDDCPKISSQYQIQSIPTLMLFKNGNQVERIVGAVMKEALVETVSKHL